MSKGASRRRSTLSPAAAFSAARPAHHRPHDLNRLPWGLARPVRALEHLARAWHRTQPERRLRHTWRRGAGQKASWARPQWPGQAAPAWPRRGSPRFHRLTCSPRCVCLERVGDALCPLISSAPRRQSSYVQELAKKSKLFANQKRQQRAREQVQQLEEELVQLKAVGSVGSVGSKGRQAGSTRQVAT